MQCLASMMRHLISRLWSGKPAKFFIIAASPRSGSTLLSTLLWRTGKLGTPLEYMNSRLVLDKTRGEPNLNYEYWRKTIERRTSTNGVFGIKFFQRHLREIAGAEPEILAEIEPTYAIRSLRRDRIAHAVSYWRALKSQSWFFGLPESISPSYKYEDVRDAEILIQNQQKFWDQLFASQSIQQIPIYYEDLIADSNLVVEQIASLMGERLSNDRLSIPAPQKQSDKFSDKVRAIYTIDRAIQQEAA